MIVIISPSKSVTDKQPSYTIDYTEPMFPDITRVLVKSLGSQSVQQLSKTLNISKTLATLNHSRYRQWQSTEKKSAMWLYSGDVYNGLDSFTMSKKSIAYAQNNLLIVSGLYGLVRPLDGIRPYRLEMKLPISGIWGNNLYEAWSKHIAHHLTSTQTDTILICASKEYAKVVTRELPKHIRRITPRFMQETNEGLKEKGLFAKYARGALARYAIDNEIESIEQLYSYNKDGFRYSDTASSQDELVYIVPPDFTLKGRFTKQ